MRHYGIKQRGVISKLTVHSPLFLRKIVEIERFPVQAANLASNVQSLAWG